MTQLTQHTCLPNTPTPSPNLDLFPPQNKLFRGNRKGQATSTPAVPPSAPWSRGSGTTQNLQRGKRDSRHYTQPGRGIQPLRTDSPHNPQALSCYSSSSLLFMTLGRRQLGTWAYSQEQQALLAVIWLVWLVFSLGPGTPKKSPGGGNELQCPYLKCIDNIKQIKPV